MHQRQDAAADAFGRIFAGIGEGQRLLAAQPKAGDEARRHKPHDRRRQRAQDGEHAEDQQVELVDRLTAPAVAEFALADAAKEHAEHGGAADPGSFGPGGEFGLDHVRDQRSEHDQIDDVEKVTGGNERDYLDVKRRYFGIVERIADEPLYGLSHGVVPLFRL